MPSSSIRAEYSFIKYLSFLRKKKVSSEGGCYEETENQWFPLDILWLSTSLIQLDSGEVQLSTLHLGSRQRQLWDQPGIHSKIQDNQGYRETLSQHTKKISYSTFKRKRHFMSKQPGIRLTKWMEKALLNLSVLITTKKASLTYSLNHLMPLALHSKESTVTLRTL